MSPPHLVDVLGCPKNVMDVEPRRMSRVDLHIHVDGTDIVLPAWVYLLLLIACTQVAILGLQSSFGPAFFLPQRVRYSIQSDLQLTHLFDGFLRVVSSRIHRGMTIIRHYRIRKVDPWVIVQFAWTR